MKKRRAVVRFLLFIALLVALLYAYFQVGFLPGRLRAYVIQKTEQLTGERVVFDKALYVPLRGLSFSNFKIVNSGGRVLFEVKTLALDVRIIPFLTEKKLIVRNVFLDSPVTDWAIGSSAAVPKHAAPAPPLKTKISGQITVPVLPENGMPDLSEIESGPDAFLPENVYLKQFEIVNGRVRVREDASGPVVEEIFPIQLKMGFQKPPVIRFRGSLRLGVKPYATAEFSGGWDLDKIRYDFNLEASSRKIPGWLARYQKNNPVVLKEGSLELQAHLVNAPATEKTALFHVRAALNEAELSAAPLALGGDMAFEADGVFDFSKKTIARYQGRLDFSHARAENPAAGIPPLEDLSGTVYFKPEMLKAKSITAAYGPLVLEAEGNLRSSSQLLLEATVRTKAAANDLLSVLPEAQKDFLKEWSVQGLCDAKISVRGSLKIPTALRWEASVSVENGAAKNALKKIDLTEISSHILAGPSSIRVLRGRVTAFKNNIQFEGEIPLAADKRAPVWARSADLDFSGSYSWRKDSITIHDALVNTGGFRTRLHGTGTGFENPTFDLCGDFQASLEKLLPKILPHAPALKDSGLRGDVDGRFILSGLLNSPLDWDLKLDAQAERLWIKEKFPVEDVRAQIRMKNRILNVPYLHLKPYGGSGGFRSSFDLSKPGVLFDGKIYVNDLNLNPLAQDMALKELAGKLNLTATLRGRLQSQESFRGSGRVNIREGRLWKTDLFKDMGNLPFVKVLGLDEVVFDALNANFKVAEKKITTQDLTLDSDTVHLKLKGSVGFDQSLDLIMWIRYSDAVMRGAMDTGGIVPFVVEKVEQVISQYKISGTLKAPKNEKILGPPV